MIVVFCFALSRVGRIFQRNIFGLDAINELSFYSIFIFLPVILQSFKLFIYEVYIFS